jgi:hypothetical protein
MNLVLAVKNAAEGFHDAWWPRLGLGSKPGATKEHWKRIWALSRRLGTPGSGDEYDNLRPVADLRQQLQTRLYVLLQNPVSWAASNACSRAIVRFCNFVGASSDSSNPTYEEARIFQPAAQRPFRERPKFLAY